MHILFTLGQKPAMVAYTRYSVKLCSTTVFGEQMKGDCILKKLSLLVCYLATRLIVVLANGMCPIIAANFGPSGFFTLDQIFRDTPLYSSHDPHLCLSLKIQFPDHNCTNSDIDSPRSPCP